MMGRHLQARRALTREIVLEARAAGQLQVRGAGGAREVVTVGGGQTPAQHGPRADNGVNTAHQGACTGTARTSL